MASSSSTSAAPKNVFVVSVGINKYKTAGNDLEGCVNDSNRMVALLRNKFKATILRQLKDEAATTAGIRDALRELVHQARNSSILVFHYSGHGSQVRDRDGDEAEGKDDIICPHDLDWDDPITDDELYRIFAPAFSKNCDVVMLMDCCHSGTVNKEYTLDVLKGLNTTPPEQVTRAKYILPPPLYRPLKDAQRTMKKSAFRDIAGKVATLLSGCEDKQTSADAWIPEAQARYGAFTYYLSQLLDSRDAGGWTYGDLHKRLVAVIKGNGFVQTPSLNPNTDSIKKATFLGATTSRQSSLNVTLHFEGGEDLKTLHSSYVSQCWEEVLENCSNLDPASRARGDWSVSCTGGSGGWSCTGSVGGHF